MTFVEHEPMDAVAIAAREAPTRVAERLWAVLWTADGADTTEIAGRLRRCTKSIDRWIARWNSGGIAALFDQPKSGQPPTLSREQEDAFLQRLTAGPRPGDGMSVFYGEDLRRILREEFAAEYSLSGFYWLLHRLKQTPLRPRPAHRKSDPEAVAEWLASAPPLSSRSAGRTRISR